MSDLDKMYRVQIKDVVGPLPNGKGIIILEAGGKTFPVLCPLPDAAACYCNLYGSPFDSPYLFLSSSLSSLTKIELLRTEILEVDSELYARLYYMSPEWKKPVRRSTSTPSEAINLCLSSGVTKLDIYKSVVDRIIDSTQAFAFLGRELGALWPLGCMTSTLELKALHDYFEEAMPHGSIFVEKNNTDLGWET